MNYHPRNKHAKILGILKSTGFVLGIFLLGAVSFTFLRPVIMPAVSSVWKTESALSNAISSVSAGFRSKSNLLEENQALRGRLASLETMAQKYKGFEERETALTLLLGRATEEGGITASVLARPPQIPYDTIIIDAGTGDGIRKGMQVILPEGSLIGEVTEVFTRQSKIELLSRAGKETSGILNRGGIPIILAGAGGANFRATLPRDAEVEVGDLVSTGDTLPRLLAEVVEIEMSPTDALKEVLFSSPTNIFSLRLVIVVP